jgi:hypothetical protein
MSRRNKTKRIYFGPDGAETSLYWTVKVTDAKKPVEMNGDVTHALKANRGHTVGCAFSCMAKDNETAFPHPVKLATFTKTAAWIVDKVDRAGQPIHAVRYEHGYGHITEANDTGTLKKMVRDNPEIMTRAFTLQVPRKHLGASHSGGVDAARVAGHKPRAATFVPRGALARAVKAGRISKPAAQQLTQVASR